MRYIYLHGFLSGPRHRTIGIPLGLAIFILYYVLLMASRVLSESLVLPPHIAIWLPNLIFLIVTITFFNNVAREAHTVYLEKFYDLTYAVKGKLPWNRRKML